MNPRLRRLFGALLFLLYLSFYIILIVAVAYGVLPDKSKAFQLVFYAIAGTIWVIPGAFIIKWMALK